MLSLCINMEMLETKLILISENGDTLKVTSFRFPTNKYEGEEVQLNPNLWWSLMKNAIKEFTSYIIGEKIGEINIYGQIKGVVFLDEQDDVVRPAIIWDEKTVNNLSVKTVNTEITGCIIPTMIWLKKNEEQNYNTIRKVMLAKDFIAYKLTNEHVINENTAVNTCLFDEKNKEWKKDLLDFFGIKDTILPKVNKNTEQILYIQPDLSKELGVLEKTIIKTCNDVLTI